jgi:hypothetical protein
VWGASEAGILAWHERPARAAGERKRDALRHGGGRVQAASAGVWRTANLALRGSSQARGMALLAVLAGKIASAHVKVKIR